MRFFKYFNVLVALAALSLSGLLIGCGANSSQGEDTSTANSSDGDDQDQSQEGSKNQDAADLAGVPVKVEKVVRRDISAGILSTAVVEAEQSVDIYSRVTGIVTEINVEEGARVSAGKLFCKLEDEELRLAEAKAKANMEKLGRDLERVKQQVEKKVLAEMDLINAQYSYDQARIEWEQKKTSLDYTQIFSTIDGIVSERLVRLGQKIDPSIKLYSLFNPKSLVVNIHIPESDYFTKVAPNKEKVSAILTSESLPGTKFSGSIKRIAPVVDPQTNTIKITIKYEDPRNILLPGMYVRVKLVTNIHENAVLVPKSAVLYEENRMYVFVVREGKSVRLLLDPGYSDTDYVESYSGVAVDEPVVVVGQTGLKDGTKVRIISDKEAAVETTSAASQ